MGRKKKADTVNGTIKISKSYETGCRCYWFSTAYKAASYLGIGVECINRGLKDKKCDALGDWKVEYDDDMKDTELIDQYTGYCTNDGNFCPKKIQRKITMEDYLDKLIFNIDAHRKRVEYISDAEIAKYKREEYYSPAVTIYEKHWLASDFGEVVDDEDDSK